ncbi:MAG: bifunctional serine/threonine-protein kinase/formylglycine-generating enzyme family protein [Planctomycetota bacterium]
MSARWERIREIVGAAIELPPEERHAFARAECGDDAALWVAVESLLRQAEDISEDFLEPPPPPPLAPRPAPPPVDDGMRLGDFVLLRELGRGGMGVVYLARQESLGREVAVKLLANGPGTSATDIARFHRESRAAAQLGHEGIAQVYMDGRHGDIHWFAMEYVRGHDLATELERQRRAPGTGDETILPRHDDPGYVLRVAGIVAAVADALAYAHRRGLVHRDVKPQNLLLDAASGRVKIADFGLVHDSAQEQLTRRSEVLGTWHYMSPEQARVRSETIDHRTDIYSLGVVLYELLTLQRPFEGSTGFEVVAKIRDQEPPSPRVRNRSVPPDLAVLCAKAMAKEPERRFDDAAVLAEELRRVIEGRPIETRRPTAGERAARWARRHRRAIGVAAALLAALWLGATLAPRHVPQATMTFREPHLAGARVSYRILDSVTWTFGERQDIGVAPCDVTLPLGDYRFVLQTDEGFAELTRHLMSEGRVYDIGDHVRIRSDNEVRDGMVAISSGEFWFGSRSASNPDHQLRRQRVDAFWVGEAEVTNGQYRAFLRDTGYQPWPAMWPEEWDPTWDNLPVADVGQADARAYAEWAGKRLVSDREWAKAGRGEAGWLTPWQQDVDLDGTRERLGLGRVPHVDTDDPAAKWATYLAGVEPVRSRPEGRSAAGLFYMLGNVCEWTETLYSRPEAEDGPITTDRGLARLKGAAFSDDEGYWRLDKMFMAPIDVREYRFGIRCAKSARP